MAVGSPVEELITSGRLEQSQFRSVHTSDFLRQLLLWKFGGTFLDLDFVVRKRFDAGLSNFACKQDSDELNTAVYNFDTDHGRYLMDIILPKFTNHFRGDVFEYNRQTFITEFTKELCKVDKISDIASEDCDGFHILKAETCFPIPWQDWNALMSEDDSGTTMQKISQSTVVHFWNKFTKEIQLDVTSNAPYMQLAREFCPRVVEAVVGKF